MKKIDILQAVLDLEDKVAALTEEVELLKKNKEIVVRCEVDTKKALKNWYSITSQPYTPVEDYHKTWMQ